MSVFKDILSRRFWVGVAAAVLTALTVIAIGAWLTVWGFFPVDRAWLVVCAAWAVGVFVGGRCSMTGQGGALWRCVALAALALGLLWAVGLTTPGDGETSHRLWYAASALVGAVLAAALPQRKRRRSGGTREEGKRGRRR